MDKPSKAVQGCSLVLSASFLPPWDQATASHPNHHGGSHACHRAFPALLNWNISATLNQKKPSHPQAGSMKDLVIAM